ncbi:septation ring formation regulator EzrA [Aquibacillus albus]|uniref:Septation ring formation regulator EzrA n=1 Tax=Aquibacillus albus TaxID=1168171 RepID=A0ABS2N421_9BACI|nr:septation ring formation regulator EzrA [Aquibacillus albus]MBM7572853.1 septation ring formation regulator [Aquibacillus albus]
MAYVIGVILIIIALIILGLILRKKVYDEVDRLEGWKMDIMNRNVTSELARIKSLNLMGETQDKFESWKDRWDHILTRELPDIEEYLLDAEEAADRFRISTAKKNLKAVEDTLESIESDIDEMFKELEHLLDSEQHSRKEIEYLQPKIKGLRKKIIQHRHLFGKAEYRFDVEIDELEEEVGRYFQLAETGNYFEGQQLVYNLKSRVAVIEEQIQAFPSLYKKCKKELPAQMDDLLAGIKQMKEDGYRIEHFGFEKELHKDQELLIENIEKLEKGITSEVQEFIGRIEERIPEMYQLLEKEAVAKSFVQKQFPSYQKLMDEVNSDFGSTLQEVEQLQETYYIEKTDMELHLSLEKWMKQLQHQFKLIQTEMNEESISHAELRELIEDSYKELLQLQESHDEFKEQIRALRKDEIEAKENVLEMRKQLYETNRKLQKSNIPGVPSFIWNLLDEAVEKSELVVKNLAKQPLDMGEVQSSLSEAKKAVLTMIEQTELLLDQARLVELVIQYANRYRSQDSVLAEKLYRAESLFRNYDYENALEEAITALEEVEPGALKRLEAFSQVPS